MKFISRAASWFKGWLLVESALQLALALNISPRTLRKLFQDAFRSSPYQFMLIHGLQCARRELLRSSIGPSSISRVATSHGFTEWGRFSQQYRRMFGELPSATMKNY